MKTKTRRFAKLAELLNRFDRARKSRGLPVAALNLIRALARGVFFAGDCFLYAHSLGELPPIPRPLDDLVLRRANATDLRLFEGTTQPSDIIWYRTLLEKDRVCILAFRGEQLVAYGWFTPQVDPRIERTYVPLASDEIFVFDLFTLPPFRRQGIQSALLRHILQLAGKARCRRVLSLVSVDNLPSVNLHERFGFQVISRFTKIRLLGLVYFRFRPNLFGRAGNVVRWL